LASGNPKWTHAPQKDIETLIGLAGVN